MIGGFASVENGLDKNLVGFNAHSIRGKLNFENIDNLFGVGVFNVEKFKAYKRLLKTKKATVTFVNATF